MIKIYGISSCDTVRKARAWLDAQGLDYTFHDFKKEGVDAAILERWADTCGWEVILNRRGTTFRKLEDADKEGLDRTRAIALMQAQPSLIKRPVAEIEGGTRTLVGFAQSEWENTFI